MITKPLPFTDAIRSILDKNPSPAQWDAKAWEGMEADVKIRSFWLAKVEDFRLIDRAQGLLFDFVAKVEDTVIGPDGKPTTVRRIGSRADFVRLMRDFMVKEGMATEREMFDASQTDLQDIKSEARLRLIFDTNVRQAYGFGSWKQGMSPLVKAAFPAAKLIRERDVNEPRERHTEALGEIRPKDDPWWASFINDPEIGGFGVPWGPYGFNSGVNQIDVSLEDAKAAGLSVDDKAAPKQPGFNDGLKASTRKMDPELKARLLRDLRNAKELRRAKVEESSDEIRLKSE